MRNMTLDDIPAGLRLCRLSGWNQIAEDWATFLEFGPNACRVIERNGAVVGTVATLRFGEAFSWVAMVLVDPAVRGEGIGTSLLCEALKILQDERCVRLDATEAGARIYRQHRFEEEYRLQRMIARTPICSSADDGLCTRMGADDLEGIFELDERVFGADRRKLLLSLLGRAPEYGWTSRTGTALKGYVFGRHGYHHDQIGPLVATGETAARQLLTRCLEQRPGRSFLLDVPNDWHGFLQSAGFEVERPLIRMYRGKRAQSEYADYQFAIAGPEFG